MKAVSEILSYLLITLLVIGLISFILSWGLPYLQKRQDEMKINVIFNNLFSDLSEGSLPSAIKRILIARSGYEKVGGFDGSWNVTNNEIIFTFVSKASPVNSNDWVLVYGCAKDVCNFPQEHFYSVEVSSQRISDYFVVKYKLVLKKITYFGDVYSLRFSSNFYSTSKYIFIEFDKIDEVNKIIYLKVR